MNMNPDIPIVESPKHSMVHPSPGSQLNRSSISPGSSCMISLIAIATSLSRSLRRSGLPLMTVFSSRPVPSPMPSQTIVTSA